MYMLKLLHFFRYIEKLRPECKHISNWENQLNCNPENTNPPDAARLPTQWLANGAGNHGSVVNALWALRNFMLQDALNLKMTD